MFHHHIAHPASPSPPRSPTLPPLPQAYQVFKARAAGADAVLLIAAVLPNSDMSYLIKAARSLGLQCLIEVHSVAELERVLRLDGDAGSGGLDGCMLGINNRDLQVRRWH